MKKVILFLAVLAAMLLKGSKVFSEEVGSKQEQVGIREVFIPGGFDRNTNVYIVASGIFPNACYSWSHAEIAHRGSYVHEIITVANVKQGLCAMVLVPFSNEIQLGNFISGRHIIKILNDEGQFFEINIDIQ